MQVVLWGVIYWIQIFQTNMFIEICPIQISQASNLILALSTALQWRLVCNYEFQWKSHAWFVVLKADCVYWAAFRLWNGIFKEKRIFKGDPTQWNIFTGPANRAGITITFFFFFFFLEHSHSHSVSQLISDLVSGVTSRSETRRQRKWWTKPLFNRSVSIQSQSVTHWKWGQHHWEGPVLGGMMGQELVQPNIQGQHHYGLPGTANTTITQLEMFY